jgi:histone deacetylase 8
MSAEYNTNNDQEFQDKLTEFGLESDCPVFEGMYEYVRWVGGASISAAQALCDNTHDVVIAWDGGRHHAGQSHAAGFCYVNDIVLAIFKLHNVFQKVLYIDIDIHHGDGVEKAFELSQRVFTLSFHRFDAGFFPGTGTLGDIGYGKGLFHSLNIPLRSGLNGDNFLKIFTNVIENTVKNYGPDVIVMQCGVDGLFGDPLGGKWNLDIKSFGMAVKHVLSYKLPTMLLGGGGYSKALAARCWTYCTAVALELEDIIPKDIPEHAFFSDYGPDFTIFCDSGNQFDRNEIGEYTDNVMEEALNLLENLKIHPKLLKEDPS